MLYLYTLVRTDLPTEAQAVQAMHSAMQSGFSGEPKGGHPTFVVLSVPNCGALEAENKKLAHAGIIGTHFKETEPAEWGITARSYLVTEIQRVSFQHLPLWRVNVWKLVWERLTRKRFRLPVDFPQL
jgi:hypothetical protein